MAKTDVTLIAGGRKATRISVNWHTGQGLAMVCGKIMDKVVDAELSGYEFKIIELSVRAYRMIRQHDCTEFLRNARGKIVVRTFMGLAITVPGTALA